MATTSSLPSVKAALLALLTTEFSGTDVSVSYAWTGANLPQAVYLGRREDVPTWTSVIDSDIATIKAGRKWRDENYTIELTAETWRSDVRPEDAAEVDAQAFTFIAEVEDVLANDPKLGLTSIQWAKVRTIEVTGRVDGSGWVVVALITLEVRARLT